MDGIYVLDLPALIIDGYLKPIGAAGKPKQIQTILDFRNMGPAGM